MSVCLCHTGTEVIDTYSPAEIVLIGTRHLAQAVAIVDRLAFGQFQLCYDRLSAGLQYRAPGINRKL
jgi:hypothetical protein